jgi:ketosteroid isomerase-like protein
MSQKSLEVAQEFYASIHAGDFDRLFRTMSQDCTIEFYGPPVIPFAGIFRGLEKCRIFFGHVANDVVIRQFTQEEFIASVDRVAVTGRLVLEFLATGRVYDSEYAHVLSVAGGKLTRFRDYQNTAMAAAVCTPIDTPDR